jgi:ligand-binding sensor domain-containing protein
MKSYVHFSFILVIIFLTISNRLYSQWTNTNGPIGGVISALATSGTNIFAGTEAGVFLSTNNGTSWSSINNGTTFQNVNAIATNGSDVYVGTFNGIFLSSDNGST